MGGAAKSTVVVEARACAAVLRQERYPIEAQYEQRALSEAARASHRAPSISFPEIKTAREENRQPQRKNNKRSSVPNLLLSDSPLLHKESGRNGCRR